MTSNAGVSFASNAAPSGEGSRHQATRENASYGRQARLLMPIRKNGLKADPSGPGGTVPRTPYLGSLMPWALQTERRALHSTNHRPTRSAPGPPLIVVRTKALGVSVVGTLDCVQVPATQPYAICIGLRVLSKPLYTSRIRWVVYGWLRIVDYRPGLNSK